MNNTTSTETTSFIVHLPAKPEHAVELESRLLVVLEAMAKEPDFIDTYLHRSINDPDTFVLYERWACTPAYFRQHHLKLPYRKDYEAALPGLLKQERSLEFLDLMHRWTKREG